MKHNNTIFVQGILWELRFKKDLSCKQSIPYEGGMITPQSDAYLSRFFHLNPESQRDAEQFLQQFQEACDQVKKEYVEEVEKLEKNPDLSIEQCQEKAKKVDQSLDALNVLVEKFKDLMKRLDPNEESS